MRCLDANEVLRFLDGDEADPTAYEDHIDGCADCRALVTELARTIEVPAAPHGSSDEPWEVASGAELVDRGTQIDKYVVLDAIGAGAMGVVYRAYDPDLDRDVALKLVRVLGAHAERDHARARLLREAQTMARLAHPNVVAVYDASIYGAHVFVAMELVEGVDLEAYLAREPRSWRAIAALFADAGRGLAAAHAAGIVHRDFKPSNVLVGDDGRVRVTDFGLAVERDAAEATTLAIGSSRLTAAGTVIGTPAYMSPEVRAGQPADPRSDQYSFAVALCEALTGAREPGPKLPAGVRALVARALAPDPAARYPSMDALVAALGRALVPVRRRALAGVAAGLVGIAALSGYVLATRDAGEVRCEPPAARLAGIWDAPRKATIRAAFLGSQHPRAADAYAGVEGALDRFAARWLQSHVDACSATHVRHEQSGELLDRRMACLHAELARLAAVTDAFAVADRDVVARAPGAAELADRLARCDDVAALRDLALPADPALRARAAAATAALARVEVTSMRGKYADAIAGARRVIAEAVATGDVRLEADATRSLAESQWRAGAYEDAIANLHRAVDAAKRARDPQLEAGALLTLVAVLGYEEARYAEALQIARLAESAIRATGDQRQLASLIGNRAAIHYAKADFAAARADYEQALAIFERLFGPDDRRTAQSVMNLAMVIAETGAEADALPLYARALRTFEAKLGARHPEVALTLVNRAPVLANLGRHDDAMADLARGLAIRIEQLGPTHRDTIQTYAMMGAVEADRGRHAAALAHLRAVAAAHDETLPAEHPQRAAALAGIGHSLVETAQWAEARDVLERALAIWTRVAPDGPQQTRARFDLARALWPRRADRARARELARAAHAALAAEPAEQLRITRWLEAHR